MIKRSLVLIGIICLMAQSPSLYGQGNPSEVYLEQFNAKLKRTEWFRDARFGMFIHYGPYAVPARGEWVKSMEKITTKNYQKYVDAFIPGNYNPTKWASLAKEAGMKYAVMTAKHHDGYCMFDSELTDYKISNNMPGRDFIKEYADAFRSEGLRVGLYYSLIDWYHQDYPHVGNHPLTGVDSVYKDVEWDKYIDFMHGQVKELMSKYGKIDVLWLDYSFGEYSDEKWKADELVKMIRSYQPDIIINSRLEISVKNSDNGRPFDGYGDFETPEQAIPDNGVENIYGEPIPWETCLTLNNNWGYQASDNEWKTSELIIHCLVEVVSKGGNLLLNVGPDAQGNIPFPSVKILKEVGTWMGKNNESIYGCGQSIIPKPDWGYFTQKNDTLFAHWVHPKIGYINIKGYTDKIDKVYLLESGEEANTAINWWGNMDKGNFFINIKKPIHYTYALPDETDTVFRIILK